MVWIPLNHKNNTFNALNWNWDKTWISGVRLVHGYELRLELLWNIGEGLVFTDGKWDETICIV